MSKLIDVRGQVSTTAQTVSVTAAPGTAGTALPVSAIASSSVTIVNTGIGQDCEIEYQLNQTGWSKLGRGEGASLSANLAFDTLYFRRNNINTGTAEVSSDSLATMLPANALPLLRPGQTVVIYGDSITNQNTQNSSTFAAYLAKGYWTQTQIMLEHRFELLNNAGVSGDTTAMMLARIEADVLAYRPQYCFFMGGTNDVGTDVSYAVTIANYASIFAKLQAAGIALIIGTITPRAFSGMTQARLTNMVALNTWLQSFAARSPGVILVDLYRQTLDYTDYTSTSQGNPVAAWFDGAGLHPLAAGAVQMGTAIARQLDTVIPRLPRRLHCNYNGTNGDSGNLVRNGMFMLGSGGTLGLNATGSVGQQWTAAATAGAISGACSLVARSASFNDGYPGNVQRVALTASGATTEIFRFAAFVTTPTVGTRVFMEVEVLASASVGTINEISITFGTVGGTAVAAAGNYMPSATETLAIGATPVKGVIRTPLITVPTGTVGAYVYILMRTSVGAVAQVDLANVRFVAG